MAASEKSGSNSNELSPEKFAAYMINIIDNAAISMAMGVGAALGLFSVMAELDQPESSDVIAKKAGLIERFVFFIPLHLCILLCLIVGGSAYFSRLSLKWRGGNKITYRENLNCPEGSRRVTDPTRWC